MSEKLIYLQKSGHFGEIILNRPARRNALSFAMWQKLPELIQDCENDPDVLIVLLHGGSTGHFAAGADISEFANIYGTREDAAVSGRVMADALNALEYCRKPVFSAIEGSCVGGGVSLAMSTDLCFASPSAKFAITPAKLGLVYPPGDMRRMVKKIGRSRSMDLLFTGRLIGSADALSYGLIDLVSDAEEHVLKAAKRYGDLVVQNSQWSTRAIKAMISGQESGWTDDHPDALNIFLNGFENQDFKEGREAFLQKRKPDFTFR